MPEILFRITRMLRNIKKVHIFPKHLKIRQKLFGKKRVGINKEQSGLIRDNGKFLENICVPYYSAVLYKQKIHFSDQLTE